MLSLDVPWRPLDLATVIVVLLVLLLGSYFLTKPSNLPPGPSPLPLVGNLFTLYKALKQKKILEQLKQWRRRYGDVFTMWMADHPVVVISDYKLLQEAFVKHGDVFSGRIKDFYVLRKIIELTGWGVLNNDGPQWKELRRVTLMSMRDFGLGKKTMEQRVQEEAREVMAVLEAGQGRPQLLKVLLSHFSSNVICSIIFGKRFEYSNEAFQAMTTLVNRVTSRPMLFHPGNFFRIFRYLPSTKQTADDQLADFKALDALLRKEVKAYEDSFDPNDVKDFVDIYLKTRSESSDKHMYTADNMRRVILDLFAAGTETSSTTLEWLVLYMVTHPQVQTRCQQEIDKVIGQDHMVTSEDRRKLPFIEAVITEVSRLATIVPLALPHVATAEGRVGGYRVPKGTILLANLREIHRDPRAWPDPDTFDPGRFLDKEGQFHQPKDNYAPFSLGPRICLGESLARLEIFIFFTTLLQRFSLAMEEGQHPCLEGHMGITYSAAPQPVIARRR